MPSPEEIVAAARSWIGTPYRHQASLKGVGCDCLGLVRGVGRTTQAEQRLEAARKGVVQADLDRRLTLERDLASAAAEVRDAERAAAVLSATAAMQEFASPPGRDSETAGVVFEILRATADGFETLSARETDLLEPGDVLRVCTAKCRTGPAGERFVAK